MDRRIQHLIDYTKEKFDLENYYLERHSISPDVNIFNETIYTLCMEWFPNHVTEQMDDGSNPEGTAVIEIDIHSHKFKQAIFVLDKTYANNGITFVDFNISEIIGWIEQETGLTYGKQFQLYKEEGGEYQFLECLDGVAMSPSGYIDVTLNPEGKLTSFSVHGQFPLKEMIQEEVYTLSIDTVEHLLKEQLKLVEIPSVQQNKIVPVYAMEEIYVMNDGKSTIQYEIISDVRGYLKIEEIIYWEAPMNKSFERKEISWSENVSVEGAFSSEPSPVSFPITKVEKDKCVEAVKNFLRQEYPEDTGKWILKTLHRDKGYIHAILRTGQQDNRIFQRKLMIMIDVRSLQAVNYMDNNPMLEIYDQLAAPEPITTTNEEAYEKFKSLIEIKPYYVYDFEQKQYVLCGKIDCHHGVHAVNGEVISIDEL